MDEVHLIVFTNRLLRGLPSRSEHNTRIYQISRKGCRVAGFMRHCGILSKIIRVPMR